MKIWIDDLRPAPDETWKAFWNSEDAIKALDVYRAFRLDIEVISFDHDLGGQDTTRPIVYWMVENDFWPQEIRIHTSNPVGREWLDGMVTYYGPPGVSA
jgi:hypothetical protein